jgi:hypothetical protein
MRKSQQDGTGPLPDTAELGGEGGSFGDGASRESKGTSGHGNGPVGEVVTDIVGNVTRLPDVNPDDEPPAGAGMRKPPTEP